MRPFARRQGDHLYDAHLLLPVRWMINAIDFANLRDIERVDSRQARDIETILHGIRPALVVSVNAASLAEVVLCGLRIELIQAKRLFALNDAEAIQRNRCRNVSLASTN